MHEKSKYGYALKFRHSLSADIAGRAGWRRISYDLYRQAGMTTRAANNCRELTGAARAPGRTRGRGWLH
jgi:hypothetical protein